MNRRWLWIASGTITALILVVIVTAALTPTQTNPAATAALTFVQAISQGDDTTALPLLDADAAAWVRDFCPDGSPSACVRDIIPEAWGDYVSTVFRRAAPEGDHWNVHLISTYERDLGGSGVCIFARVEQTSDGSWKVSEYAGFINCGDPASRNMATNPETPNRIPGIR
jgi:hypothetical protein